MALSEMPAMTSVTLSLYFQLRGLKVLHSGRSVLWWYLASGVLLSIAVWGRQPYLLLAGIPVLSAIIDRRLVIPALYFACLVALLTVPLFIIWRGVVPPKYQTMEQGVSLLHGLLSFSYTGISFLLLVPQAVRLPRRWAIGVVAVSVLSNAVFDIFAVYPMRSICDRYLSSWLIPVWGNIWGSAFIGIGVVSLVEILGMTWRYRYDLKQFTVWAGLLFVALSPLFIVHQYSSRYTAMSLPYLVLAAQPLRQWNIGTAIAAVVGCFAGCLSLIGYFA
jgi:hypothetical protein